VTKLRKLEKKKKKHAKKKSKRRGLRLLHTADLHLGATAYLPRALERQLSTLRWIFRVSIKKQVDALIIAGDVFHEHSPAQYVKDAFLKVLLDYEDRIDFPVLVIEGNHSQSLHHTSLETYAELERRGKLRNFYFATSEPRFLEFERFNALLIPYGLEYESILEEFRPRAAERPTVAVLHELFDGADLGLAGRFVKSKKKLPCFPDYFYYALGDVHQYGPLDHCPKAWYSGSPIQHTVGETLPKGVLLVEDPSKPRLIETPRKVAWPIVRVKEGEPIPEDAYVIYHGEATPDLPPNVVQVVPPKARADKSAVETIDAHTFDAEYIMQLIREELEESGFPEDEIQEKLKIARPHVYAVFGRKGG